MRGETGERWRRLCEQAAIEQDPDRLLELAKEISRLLDEKEERLKQQREQSASVNSWASRRPKYEILNPASSHTAPGSLS